jgi:DNA-binding XRE family transcriptional regulator
VIDQPLPGFFDVITVNPQDEPVRASSVTTRRQGLDAAALTRDNLWKRMLQLYAQHGYTDAEMAICLGVERSTVNARRDELVTLEKVRDTGETRKNPRSGIANTVWGLA